MLEKSKLISLFDITGTILVSNDLANSSELYGDQHDVHAFYRFGDETIHVQGYPAFSTAEFAYICARVMSTEILGDLRRIEASSIGNEHEAVTREVTDFGSGAQIEYSPQLLASILIRDITRNSTLSIETSNIIDVDQS